MNHSQSDLFNPLFNDFINQILSIRPNQERPSISKPKDSGPTKIDINISLSNNNIQTSISDSFSKELQTESVRDLERAIEMFVRDVVEAYGQA